MSGQAIVFFTELIAKIQNSFFKWEMGLSQPLFLYFRLFYILKMTEFFLLMLGFEPHISADGSDRSASCATANCPWIQNSLISIFSQFSG